MLFIAVCGEGVGAGWSYQLTEGERLASELRQSGLNLPIQIPVKFHPQCYYWYTIITSTGHEEN